MFFLHGSVAKPHQEGVYFCVSQPQQRVFVCCKRNPNRGCWICIFPAHHGHLYVLISTPIRCVWLCLFAAPKGCVSLLILCTKGVCFFADFLNWMGSVCCCNTAPKRVHLSTNFQHKRVRLDMLITAPKGSVLLFIFWTKGCGFTAPKVYVLLAYFLHKGCVWFDSQPAKELAMGVLF